MPKKKEVQEEEPITEEVYALMLLSSLEGKLNNAVILLDSIRNEIEALKQMLNEAYANSTPPPSQAEETEPI